MEMRCAYCDVLFKRPRRRGSKRHQTTYCSHACFAKNVARVTECLTCAVTFKRERYIPGFARIKYCSDLCINFKDTPFPPLEIYGDEEDQNYMLSYRRQKLLNQKKDLLCIK